MEPKVRTMRRTTRTESYVNTVNEINRRSGPVATDSVIVSLLREIAGSLAVIADAMTEGRDGDEDD